jgi:hypothetical protein
MAILFPHGLLPDHEDYRLMKQLEEAILRHAGGIDRFKDEIPRLFRQGIDEVIDPARSNRFTLDEIEKTEKTYLGTKLEILIRSHLKMKRGKVLDLAIDEIETNVKNTIGSNWTIPIEAMGHPCILVKSDEKKAICSFGILVIRDDRLNPKPNRDGKRTVSGAGRQHIHWLLKDQPYPENFWQNLPPALKKEIISPTSGTKRVATLFRRVQGKPISRTLVLALAQQDDAMKRLRKNGGARDSLAREGIAILSGQYDRELILDFGLPKCGRDEFLSFKPTL